MWFATPSRTIETTQHLAKNTSTDMSEINKKFSKINDQLVKLQQTLKKNDINKISEDVGMLKKHESIINYSETIQQLKKNDEFFAGELNRIDAKILQTDEAISIEDKRIDSIFRPSVATQHEYSFSDMDYATCNKFNTCVFENVELADCPKGYCKFIDVENAGCSGGYCEFINVKNAWCGNPHTTAQTCTFKNVHNPNGAENVKLKFDEWLLRQKIQTFAPVG